MFEDVGVVDAMGASMVPGQYQLLDPTPYKGLSYYRLRQVDQDGSVKHSSIVPVELHGRISEALLVPNPSEGDVLLLFTAQTEGSLLVRMYDPCGRVVVEKTLSAIMGRNSFPLATSTLAQGMYTVTIGSDRDLITLRFFKD